MVSSGNQASSASERVAKVSAVVHVPPPKRLSKERLRCRCSPDDGLWSCCAGHGVLNILQGCINPITAPFFPSFPALPRPLWGFPGSPLHLETLLSLGMPKVSWTPHAMPVLLEFPKCQVVASLGYIFSVFGEWLFLINQEVNLVLGF